MIVALTAAETHPLRRLVLRAGTPSQDVDYPQDGLPGTIHLGWRDRSGGLLGVSSWARDAWDGRPDAPAVRLRGMAVDTTLQRSGIGALLVAGGVGWSVGIGAELIWATARDAVLGFYQRAGFEVLGDGFVDGPTTLPHHLVVRHL